MSGWNCGWLASAGRRNWKVGVAELPIELSPSDDDDGDGAYVDGGASGDAAFWMIVEPC